MEMVRIASISALPGYRLQIAWKDGAASTVSVADFVQGHPVFEPIRRDPALFEAVTAGEWGECAHWSEMMEISAYTLWQRAQALAAE